MPDLKNIKLVSSEISGLWDSYMSDSLLICVLRQFLNNVEDNDIQTLLQHTLNLSIQHISIITDIFNQEGLPIPQGFTDKDVNINSPRLFSDTFYAAYISFIARVGMHDYTLTLNQIARSDIRKYFSKCITEYIGLYNKAAELRLSKGIFIRAPHIEIPKEVQFVGSQSFIFNIFEKKRALLAREITHIFSLISADIIGDALATGFSQVSRDKKISAYFLEGKHLGQEIIAELTSILVDEDIPIPTTSESFVTDSTESPFSEKLMLYHALIMTAAGVSSKGAAIAQSMRADLEGMYTKLIAKIMKYTKDGIDIMNDNKFLEQPPQAISHEKLVKI